VTDEEGLESRAEMMDRSLYFRARFGRANGLVICNKNERYPLETCSKTWRKLDLLDEVIHFELEEVEEINLEYV
jgi:hypothetical protein